MSNLTVKQLRDELGLSIKDTADLMGVKRSQCEQWLYGQRNPSKATQKFINLLFWMHNNNYLKDYMTSRIE